jgi:four helix bundle protein
MLSQRGMGARHFRDLRAWQLSYELKTEVLRLTGTEPAVRDRRFCDQLRDAVSSATANIAEGFGRLSHREFAQFLNVARGSLTEAEDRLQDALDRGYIGQQEFERLSRLTARAKAAVTGLLFYLRRTPDRYPSRPPS